MSKLEHELDSHIEEIVEECLRNYVEVDELDSELTNVRDELQAEIENQIDTMDSLNERIEELSSKLELIQGVVNSLTGNAHK